MTTHLAIKRPCDTPRATPERYVSAQVPLPRELQETATAHLSICTEVAWWSHCSGLKSASL